MTDLSLTDQTISVIIPTLNEAKTLPLTLNKIQTITNIEVVVVDGGSLDATVQIAESLGAKVVNSTAGRSHQMNLGADVARGDILLFLHADTCLPTEFDRLIRQALQYSGVIAGAFELKIDGVNPGLRIVEWGVKWRSRLFQMPYGDQAIFLRSSIFHEIGGFPDLPIMEDFEFIRKLKRHGQIAIVPAAVLTSDRRWRKLNICRTTLINQLIILGYLLKVPPARLAYWYRSWGK
ncbi:MAG: TIGR04283 family arsenosugar biosynthesis glycosyltransferase [Leptodesmis sp.]|uniref:TIGR04283 family arsenosugar biosynthesis glycosyltransferase n=1 Tax=Leptodesmis sp. TaxID=3100501 RepID=UPI003D139D4B